ncbi:hypothetical protein HN028_14320 [Pantoea ananatis]|uniref:hypothetical protein n=1 Tax=Pantoea ananas TaxID=553 RepID=UPI00352BBE6C
MFGIDGVTWVAIIGLVGGGISWAVNRISNWMTNKEKFEDKVTTLHQSVILRNQEVDNKLSNFQLVEVKIKELMDDNRSLQERVRKNEIDIARLQTSMEYFNDLKR